VFSDKRSIYIVFTRQIMAPYINDMASPRSPTRAPLAPVPAAAGDGFDDLFDYDMADDVFRDLTPPPVIPTNDNSRKSGAAAGIGIDEEVKVAKKPRAPRVKLDENRYV
jgi:replication fork protection complex subunit Csm3/Swi3